jgi:hypothetical protein
MKVYTLQETDHSEMMECLEGIMKKAHKLLERFEDMDSKWGSRYGSRNEYEEDYDWKIRKGNRY